MPSQDGNGEGHTSDEDIVARSRWDHRSTGSGMERRDWQGKLGTLGDGRVGPAA